MTITCRSCLINLVVNHLAFKRGGGMGDMVQARML